MNSKKQQSFLQGAIILLIGTVLVKIIGALFKIPLTNLIGGDGMGYFGTAYNLFNPISSLAVAGLPVAVSKLISENASLGRYRDVKKIRAVSYAIFFITGTVGMFVMLFSARFFSNIFSNPGAFRAMLCIAPAVFFLCLMSAYRGYYVGLSNMYPTAISQIIEAFCKLVFGLALAYLAIYVGDRQIPTGVVFGIEVLDISQARAVVMSYSAAGAVLGVTIGTAFGFIYLVLYDKLKGVR
ncbi:MAG: oligosaccharide flippase family protein, partial [Oscillospiraceae bacterium]|nr:oligosaccharide flippase family protein [Oscillospiraceae bacterium]